MQVDVKLMSQPNIWQQNICFFYFRNPEKGVIINQPGGPNVYPGVPKDYTGLEVSGVFPRIVQG